MEQTVTRQKNMNTVQLVKISMLSAVSIVLMMFEIGFPIFPSFLKMDLSDLPALIGAVSMGPMAGVLIELIKNILHLLKTSTAGVGEVANFLVGIAFVVPIGIFYRKDKTVKNFLIGSFLGTALMIVTACVFNYYVLIPLYAKAFGMPIQAFADMAHQLNSLVVDFKTLVYFSIAPFNFIKAVIVAAIGYLVCKVLRPVLRA